MHDSRLRTFLHSGILVEIRVGSGLRQSRHLVYARIGRWYQCKSVEVWSEIKWRQHSSQQQQDAGSSFLNQYVICVAIGSCQQEIKLVLPLTCLMLCRPIVNSRYFTIVVPATKKQRQETKLITDAMLNQVLIARCTCWREVLAKIKRSHERSSWKVLKVIKSDHRHEY